MFRIFGSTNKTRKGNQKHEKQKKKKTRKWTLERMGRPSMALASDEAIIELASSEG